MFQIDETEAINRLLQGLDGTIISDVDDPENDTVIQIQRALTTAVEKVQIENEWNFNIFGLQTITADDDDEINLPSDCIFIRFHSWTNGSVWNLTAKGTKAWDRKLQTTAVGGTVEISGTKKFEYDDLSGAMQNLVIEKAKEEYNGLAVHLSAPRIVIAANAYRDAYQGALKWDSEQKFGAMDFSPSFRDSILGQYGNNAGWAWMGNF